MSQVDPGETASSVSPDPGLIGSPEITMQVRDELRQRVMSDVFDERVRQFREEGWSIEHDDAHQPNDWGAMLARYVGRALDAAENADPISYRRRLVQVAAVAVAAIEQVDAVAPEIRGA